MKLKFWIIVLLLVFVVICVNLYALSHLHEPAQFKTPAVPPKIPSLQGLYQLLQRRAPLQDQNKVSFKLTTTNDMEYYHWHVYANQTAVIEGNSLSSLSYGLGDLYRTYCHMELVSWSDSTRLVSFERD
jgi:hypothetical protein